MSLPSPPDIKDSNSLTSSGLDISSDDQKYIHSVPTTITEHHIYMDETITSDSPWLKPMMNKLTEATNNDIIHIHLNNYGGSIHLATQLMSSIDRCVAKEINLYVEGACASAATLITFGCNYDNLVVSEFASFLFHNGFSFQFGKPSDNKSSVIHHESYLKYLFKKVYEDILTSSEQKRILEEGYEHFMLGTEVIERLENRAERRKKRNLEKKR